MNLRQLDTLIMIADAGSLARAAGRLNLSQPAASRQIQALETDLGVRLFDRSGRHLQLTSDGEEIVRRARRLLHEADSLRDRAKALKGGQTGALRIGASPQNIETVLVPFLPGFRKRHPGIEIHFVEGGGAQIHERLERGDAQLVLTNMRSEPVNGRLLFPSYLLAALARYHRFARRASIDVSELADEPVLLLQRGFASRGWFDAECHNVDIRPQIVLESAAPHTLIALAAIGEGVAIVPSNVRIPRELVRIVPVTSRGAPIGRWIVAMWDARRFVPAFARQFVDELAGHCKRSYPGRDLTRRTRPLQHPKDFLGVQEPAG
jgi:LysR family transcriptional regulator, cyn operon transcriptional activator